MDDTTARALIALNNTFYAEHAASFSATRSAPWGGWERVVDELVAQEGRLGHAREDRGAPLQVLDLACGNLRFERYLAQRLCDLPLRVQAVDACEPLARTHAPSDASIAHARDRQTCAAHAPARCGAVRGRGGATTPADLAAHVAVMFREVDILDDLMRRSAANKCGSPRHLSSLDAIPPCDLSVCFGFMHHVPGADLRKAVVDALVSHTAPKGLVAISFWQFMDDPRLSRKAISACDAPAGIDPTHLEANDRFLGWQDDPRPLRYCHHTADDEIDALVASVGTRALEVARYSADGSSGTLNRYVILQRRP